MGILLTLLGFALGCAIGTPIGIYLADYQIWREDYSKKEMRRRDGFGYNMDKEREQMRPRFLEYITYFSYESKKRP